ncbi:MULTISPECIES: hypothetical protein [unclassified Rathayibacter]|uniref:hypothetical protein n=1 Tax=unclassified Rathayibacter TaxID=2609250 RepID=UPI00188C3DEC|nr:MULTISPECIES: hypothetical protein [unclassified Rathayibacter]MBF4462914.1 hypothetical protein [Rathayibacter sp. VKM Ac-2879]MBF4504328.1 hypothetical protein [Rathayibacter sp. VKM Ac-2878]
MPDWSRFLPLSTRVSVDESGVSNDWRPLVAERLDRLAVLAASPSFTEGEAASAVSGRLLGELVVRLSSTTGQRLATRVGAREAATPPPPAALAAALASIAAARRSGIGPHSVAELVEVVRVELALTPDAVLPERVSGGVALDRVQRAPLAIRATVRGHTLAPPDAEWTLGSGPELRAPSTAILRFLLGLGPFPAGTTP